MKSEWVNQLYPYFQTNSFIRLSLKIAEDREVTEVFPIRKDIFRVFNETDLSDVKVNIMGVEPYSSTYADSNPIAIGRSFACNRHFGMQPSLKNIIKELEDDIKLAPGFNPSLQDWVDQGVLLLNTSLTVCKGKKGSHTEYWKDFTIAVCKALNTKDDIVHILWGKNAQSFKQYFTNPTHKFIESPSPSSFSASNGFFGSKPFSKCNKLLKQEINWLDELRFKPKLIDTDWKDRYIAGTDFTSQEEIKILPYEGQDTKDD